MSNVNTPTIAIGNATGLMPPGVMAKAAFGSSLAGGPALLLRYPSDSAAAVAQSAAAALLTGGYLGTGAQQLSDFLDEARPLGAGWWLGITYTRPDPTAAPNIALWFTLRQRM